jgi:hypothetical protein
MENIAIDLSPKVYTIASIKYQAIDPPQGF